MLDHHEMLGYWDSNRKLTLACRTLPGVTRVDSQIDRSWLRLQDVWSLGLRLKLKYTNGVDDHCASWWWCAFYRRWKELRQRSRDDSDTSSDVVGFDIVAGFVQLST